MKVCIIWKKKVAPLVKLASPKNVTEIRHIVGLASYYRKFIENFSDMVKSQTLQRRIHFLIGTHYVK